MEHEHLRKIDSGVATGFTEVRRLVPKRPMATGNHRSEWAYLWKGN